jgi:hypothetical protein
MGGGGLIDLYRFSDGAALPVWLPQRWGRRGREAITSSYPCAPQKSLVAVAKWNFVVHFIALKCGRSIVQLSRARGARGDQRNYWITRNLPLIVVGLFAL